MKNLLFDELTLEQKLGMVYCARPKTDEDIDFTVELIKKHALGCVQLSPKKPHHMQRVREAADYPLLIICDTEKGFPTSDLPKISLMALSACNEPKYFRTFAKGVVTEAKKAGFNGTWGPVIDILDAERPASPSRKFSDDPMRVARCAEEIARVYKQYGYLSCGKHYPGGTKALGYDGHMAPSYANETEEDLRSRDLLPYKYLMDKGLLPSIMTSHMTFAKIDPDNAGTLSPKVQGIIRDMGFEGVCFSDSFAMMAILQKYGEENVQGLAIAAGVDIVLPNYRTRVKTSFEWLVKNYEDGMFTQERLDEAVRRVLKAQEFVGTAPETDELLTDEDRAIFDSMAKDCITAVCDEGVDAALPAGKSHLFVIVTDNSFSQDEAVAALEISEKQWYFPEKIAKKIQEVYPDAGIIYLPELPNAKENERVLVESKKYDDVVFVTYCNTAAYLGTDCMTRRVENLIDCVNLGDKLEAIVHFGNPFALQPLLHVKRKILGYNMPTTQPYTIDVLAGKIPAKGTLPFDIKFK